MARARAHPRMPLARRASRALCARAVRAPQAAQLLDQGLLSRELRRLRRGDGALSALPATSAQASNEGNCSRIARPMSNKLWRGAVRVGASRRAVILAVKSAHESSVAKRDPKHCRSIDKRWACPPTSNRDNHKRRNNSRTPTMARAIAQPDVSQTVQDTLTKHTSPQTRGCDEQ